MRLFTALPLPDYIEQKLGDISDLLKEQGGKVRWVPAENIHLTVRFLGETEDERVPKLVRVLDEIVPQFDPAVVVIDRLGGFPNIRKPRVIWAGLAEDDNVERLTKMTRQIELAVRKLRFEPEKKGFKPHLTLGRVKDPKSVQTLASFIESYRFDPIQVHLGRVVLFRSTLTPKGAVYERLHEVKMGEDRLGG